MVSLLSHLVDESAARLPEHDAFRFVDTALTYADLADRSDRLASVLIEHGVRTGDRVGIFLHKGLEQAVAVHGIFKAGAAYVPIDPAMPARRLRFILQDAGIRHLVTQPAKLATLHAIPDLQPLSAVFGVADDTLPLHTIPWSEVALAPPSPTPSRPLSDRDMAYLMYTSGSTGAPKGIIHTHYSGLSYARLSAATYGVRSNDRLGNHSPLHFDMSTFEFLTGPLAGATTVIVPEAYTKLPASLSQLIERERLTIWYSVPLALIHLLHRGVLDRRDLSSLRWVLFGGEIFPSKYIRHLREFVPDARFSNVYGPAEVNQCTFHHVTEEDLKEDAPVPLGRIWDETEGLVVDENDRPVEPGRIGELLVRTPTMMTGYWERPDLDARCFYFRHRDDGPADRFFRTGDLVEVQEDGRMRFHGRKDRQVKVRGHRVELDEIENTAASLQSVEEAAAYVVTPLDREAEIFLDVTLTDPDGATTTEIGQFLRDHLPPYAVPSRLRIVPAFPRTGSGKIDRKTLHDEAEAAISAIS